MTSASTDDDPALERGIADIDVIVELAGSSRGQHRCFAALAGHEEADDIDFGTIEARVIGAAEQVVRTRIGIDKHHAAADGNRHL